MVTLVLLMLMATFLSTPSARRATNESLKRRIGTLFLSTPSARRATWFRPVSRRLRWISIHALREEGDNKNCPAVSFVIISIHALREEGDRKQDEAVKNGVISIHALREEGDWA